MHDQILRTARRVGQEASEGADKKLWSKVPEDFFPWDRDAVEVAIGRKLTHFEYQAALAAYRLGYREGLIYQEEYVQ